MGNQKHTYDSQGNSPKERVLLVSSGFSVPSSITRLEAWYAVEKKIAALIPGGKEIKFDFRFYIKIAASICIIALAAYTFYGFQHVHVLTGRGEHQLITLPDHSTVLLNAGSALQYNKFLFAFTRIVYFNGEGFFTVQKGSRFKVVSHPGKVEVLGTQFNLVSRKATYDVACVEGKVKVTNSASTSGVILTAGLNTTLMNKILAQPKIFKSTLTAWKNGEFYFDNSPLNDVLATLELQYNIKVHFDGSADRSYSGYFTNNNLEESLKLVCLPLGLKYEFLNTNEVKLINN